MSNSSVSTHYLRDKVAAALDVRPEQVKIERWRFSPGARSTRSWGTWTFGRFFAKSLILHPYPLIAREAFPGEDNPAPSSRSADEQIEKEWARTTHVREVVGPKEVPMPLGRSLPASTIVWEQAQGERLDDAVKRTWWAEPKASRSCAALCQAGAWLRKLHDRTACGTTTLDLTGIMHALSETLNEQRLQASPYADAALAVLRTGRDAGGNQLPVPIVMSHGDFLLANLLLEATETQLSVVDFEDLDLRNVLHDLITMIFDLRALLLNPFISRPKILSLEKAFWQGYGPIPEQWAIWVNALACSRIFYYYLPRLSTRYQRQGWLAGAVASLYRAYFENSMISRCISYSLNGQLSR